MSRIPPDVRIAIDGIDESAEAKVGELLHEWNGTYLQLLVSLFPECQIVDMTEFDAGRACRFMLALHTDPEAAALDTARLTAAVRRYGFIEIVHVAISVVAPYCLLQYVRYVWTSTQADEQRSYRPITAAQQDVASTLLKSLSQQYGIRPMEPDIAKLPVPDVETAFADVGDATVADCLFFG